MNIRILIIIVLSFIITSCREINVSTKVNADGSCEKSISIYAESDNALENLFPYSLDDSWKMYKKENVKENKNLYTFTKKFNELDSYNSEFRKNGNSTSIIQKEFRWFFTYYKYQEKYRSYNEFNLIPAEKFFTAGELERLQKGEDTVWINDQTKRWQEQNIFEEVFQAVMKGAKRINGKQITPGSLQAGKDELFKSVTANEKSEIDDLIDFLNKRYNTDEALLLKPELQAVESSIGNKLELMGRAEGDYKNEIILPGIIVNTNADALVGNKAMWNFNSDKYLISDYEMYAESRELNTTFITGSGLVVILLIGGLTFPLFRKAARG